MASLKHGNNGGFAGYTRTWTYNNRLQPDLVQATSPTQTIFSLDYDFDSEAAAGVQNNGNVIQIANTLNPNRTQNFTYDELNRIKTAESQATSGTHCWGQRFGEVVSGNYVSGYDIWANLTKITVSKCSTPTLNVTVNSNNRISSPGYSYDAAGNLMAEPAKTYVYDAEGHLTSTAGVSYVYDGDGRRVKKSNGTLYWYGLAGEVLLETNLSGTLLNEYIFFNGQRVARRNSAGTIFYYFEDHLGTSRVIVQAGSNGACYEADFYPFGGERPPITNTCPQNYKFTGLERDAESLLDHTLFRKYPSNLARWLSPDPMGGHQENPQSLNRYVYTVNNPLKYIDPFGLDFWIWGGEVCIKASQCDGDGFLVDEAGERVVVKSADVNASEGGPTATLDERGLLITTEQGTFQGAFIPGTDSLNIAGSGALEGFDFTINGNCRGTCLSSGSWTYNGSLDDARALLNQRGSFRILGPLEDIRAGFGRGAHPFSTQHRFGGPLNSPHLSVLYDAGTSDYRPADVAPKPRANVPATGEFHVDAHSDWWGHLKDVLSRPNQ